MLSFPSTPILSYQPVHTVPSLSLRCAESVHPHPVGYWTQRHQLLIILLPSAVQQQLQDLWRSADLYWWDRQSTYTHTLNRSHEWTHTHLYLRWHTVIVTKQAFGQTVLGISTCEKWMLWIQISQFTSLSGVCLHMHSENAHCHMSY